MGLTNWFGLRKPTDPAVPADLITIVGALADDTDATLKRELDGKSGTAHTHNYAAPHDHPYAAAAHGHDYAAPHDHPYAVAWHGHDYASPGHGHNPSASGIGVLHHNFGSLSAGQTKSQRFGRSNDQFPVVSVNHPSSYIVAVISVLDDGGFTVEVRNTTASTNHTNVHVIVHLVRSA